MGDIRFQAHYEEIRDAENPLDEIRHLSDEEVVAALAAATGERDPYIVNVLATEAMNRARRANTLMRALGDGVVALDTTKRIRDLNPAAEHALGVDCGEVRGRPFDTLRAKPPPTHRDPLETVLEESRTEHWNHEAFHGADGRAFPVAITASPIERDGEVTGAVVVFQDITRRKRIEAELSNRAAAMDASMDGMAILDASQRYTYVNPAHARIYGYDSPDELVGRTWHVLYDDRTRRLLAEQVLPVVRSEGQWRGEAVGRRRNGETFPQELTLTLLENGGLVCVVRDTTALEKRESQLRQERERYASLFERNVDAVYEFDTAGLFITANPACETVTGYRPDELIGTPFLPLIVPEDRGRAQEAFEDALRGEPSETEVSITQKDGTRADLRVKKLPIYTDGRVVGVFGVARDITEDNRRDRLHREQATRLQAVLRTLGRELDEGFVILSSEGRIQTVNDAATRILGVPREDLVGRIPQEVDWSATWSDGSPIPEGEGPITKTFRTGQPARDVDLILRAPDGRRIPIALTAVPARVDGETPTLIVTFTDLTQRRETQDEITRLNEALERRVHQLEAAYEELDAFSYSASHDLRAPLRAITYLGEALEEDYGADLPDGAQEYLERMRREATRMTDLVNDLLRLSRVSRAEIHKTEVDLSAIASDIVKDLRERNPGRRAEIHIEQGVRARGDPVLLRIVLENLLGNAWKYSARRDRTKIEFGREDSEDGPVYFVRDYGVGFDPERASKLFQPFQRLHAPTEYPGTGIGLATVRRIVERHGGRVWATSEPGKGATFRFTL